MRGSGVFAAVAGPFACAMVAGPAAAAQVPPQETPSWVITPETATCRTDLDLDGRSGAVTPVSLSSDGERVTLRFTMEGAPERAFLPIRIDQKAYPNLVLRGDGPGQATMTLSDETLAAMRRGRMLQIAWLSDEAVHGALAGVGQGLADLKTCGAQVAARDRTQQAQLAADRAHAEADRRARAVADEQLAAIRAQREAAEADTQAKTAEAARARAEAERLAAQAEQDRAYVEQARQRTLAQQYYDDRRAAAPPPYEDEEPQPEPWAYRRYAPR